MIHPIKSFFYFCFASVLTASACACSSDDNDEPTSGNTDVVITVTPETITTSNEARATEITISANADWSISSDATWCKCFPSGGLKNTDTSITLSIESNSGSEERTATLTVTSGKTEKKMTVTQSPSPTVKVNANALNFGAQGGSTTFTVTSNTPWELTPATTGWFTVSPESGIAGETEVTVTCKANDSDENRTATIIVAGEGDSENVKITQYTDVITTPDGYTLVWNDEFNTPDGSSPDLSKWYYEEWAPGYVNNELQRYVAGALGNDRTAEIIGGVLNITARKSGSEVISARLNTKEMWTYGYFEARLKLPKGKGTWPAYWMMPADGNNWPHCGEIDIMEEVGTNPNYTSSSIHCTAYNHTIGTQKTAERLTPGAEDEFHTYALEWTPDFIRTFADGVQLFYFANDKKGDENTWPFDKPFHPILNLAWGGSWGGMNGVDESALPTTYMIDYVRVFQKL